MNNEGAVLGSHEVWAAMMQKYYQQELVDFFYEIGRLPLLQKVKESRDL